MEMKDEVCSPFPFVYPVSLSKNLIKDGTLYSFSYYYCNFKSMSVY